MDGKELQSFMNGFTGTENHHKHLFGGLYSDGVFAMAEKVQAHWLIDAIFSYRRREEFQIWTLDVKDSKAILTMKEDSDQPVLVKQDIGFTDFPEGTFKFYLSDRVLFLPSEY